MDSRYNWSGGTGVSSIEWQVQAGSRFDGNFCNDANNYDNDNDNDRHNAIKIVVLGARGVGKTAIINRFLHGHYESNYYPTSKNETHHGSVIMHDKTYALSIVDVPDAPSFAANAFHSAADTQTQSVRDANAFVLVYDLLSPESFETIGTAWTHLNDARDLTHVPIVVAGNKTDRVNGVGHRDPGGHYRRTAWRGEEGRSRSNSREDLYHQNALKGFGHHHDFHSSHKSGRKGRSGRSGRSSGHKSSSSLFSHYGSELHDPHNEHLHEHKSGSKHSRYHRRPFHVAYEEDNILELEVREKVVHEWRAVYRECSANDADSVEAVFKAVLRHVEEQGVAQDSDSDDGAISRKCVIL